MEVVLTIILILLCIAGYIWSNLAAQKASIAVRERLKTVISPHLKTLILKRERLLYQDDYGMWQAGDWFKELESFRHSALGRTEFRLVNLGDLDQLIDELEDGIPRGTVAAWQRPDYEGIGSGQEFEEAVADELARLGFNVRMVGGTGDQGVDLIATRHGAKIALQCKWHTATIGNKAVQEVAAGRQYHECDSAVVVGRSSYTRSALALAKSLGVRCVHYTDLQDMCEELANEAAYFKRGDPAATSGVVKWYNIEKQFGFIQVDGQNKDLYISGFKGGGTPPLDEGDVVAFDVEFFDDGQGYAANVTKIRK